MKSQALAKSPPSFTRAMQFESAQQKQEAQDAIEQWLLEHGASLRKTIDHDARRIAKRVLPGIGRGIVMCAGGPYLPEAYASLMWLREVGCALPVEIVHAGPKEIPLATLKRFKRDVGHVVFVDATKIRLGRRPTNLRGYEIKAFALLASSFEEILMLDSDCSALRDPEFLFHDPNYLAHGNIFWPDYWVNAHLMHKCLGANFGTTTFAPGFETESGQILVNKNRCLEALVYAWLLNANSELFYHLYYGDKDLYRVGFNMARARFFQVRHIPGILGYEMKGGRIAGDSMVQKAPRTGAPLFVHRTMRKRIGNVEPWDAFVPNDGPTKKAAACFWDVEPMKHYLMAVKPFAQQLRPATALMTRMSQYVAETAQVIADLPGVPIGRTGVSIASQALTGRVLPETNVASIRRSRRVPQMQAVRSDGKLR